MAGREESDRSLLVLGDWLARWRRSVGVSQRVLAGQAGIHQSGLSRVERGMQVIGARRLAQLICSLDMLARERPGGPVDPPPVRRPWFDEL
jgi:transcriptional regulator with XRE-family HTH domain